MTPALHPRMLLLEAATSHPCLILARPKGNSLFHSVSYYIHDDRHQVTA